MENVKLQKYKTHHNNRSSCQAGGSHDLSSNTTTCPLIPALVCVCVCVCVRLCFQRIHMSSLAARGVRGPSFLFSWCEGIICVLFVSAVVEFMSVWERHGDRNWTRFSVVRSGISTRCNTRSRHTA